MRKTVFFRTRFNYGVHLISHCVTASPQGEAFGGTTHMECCPKTGGTTHRSFPTVRGKIVRTMMILRRCAQPY